MRKTILSSLLGALLFGINLPVFADGCDDLIVNIHNHTEHLLSLSIQEHQKRFFSVPYKKTSLTLLPNTSTSLNKIINHGGYRFISSIITIPMFVENQTNPTSSDPAIYYKINKHYTSNNTPGKLTFFYKLINTCEEQDLPDQCTAFHRFYFKEYLTPYVRLIKKGICGPNNIAEPGEATVEIFSSAKPSIDNE